MILSLLFVGIILSSMVAFGQTVYTHSYIWYDQGTNTVNGYAEMTSDYYADYYYIPWVLAQLQANNQWLDWSSTGGGTYSIAYVSAPGQLHTRYDVNGTSYVDAYYSYWDPYYFDYWYYDAGYFNYWGSTCSDYRSIICGGGPPLWIMAMTEFLAGFVYDYLQVEENATVHISEWSNGGRVPLRSGTGINTSSVTASGSPLGGTYNWSTTSNKVSLSNIHSPTVTVTGLAESAPGGGDVPLQVTYEVSGLQPSSPDTANMTVQKPTSMGFLSYGFVGANWQCDQYGLIGYRKDITWRVEDRDGGPMPFSMPTGDPGEWTRNDFGLDPFEGSEAYTYESGQWPHTYWFCTTHSKCPGTGEVDGVQHWHSNGWALPDKPFVFKCNSISVDGH
jgi:hypothetical protein